MIEAIAIAIAVLGAVLLLILFARIRAVDAELKLKKHRAKDAGLADLLNYAAVADDGVIVGKNGSFMDAWLYKGDDNASSTEEQREMVSFRINQLHDPNTGALTSVVDGIWLLVICGFGWLGYFGRFGLLTAPILLFALRRRSVGDSFIPFGLIVTLSATLIDLLPNSGLVNYVWLMAGAVAGHVLWWRGPGAEAAARSGAVGQADMQPFGAPPRAAWLMPDTGPTGREGRHDHRTGGRR